MSLAKKRAAAQKAGSRPKGALRQEEDPKSPLQIQEFRFFIIARFFVTASFQCLHVSISWQILYLTKSPLALGISGLVEFTTHFLLAFIGGHLADRCSRRRILLLCIGAIALCSLFLLALNLFSTSLALYPIFSLGALYTVIAVIGVIRAFFAPAAWAFMAHIVPPKLYPKSSAWNSTLWQTASVGGPALAGLLYANLGAAACYALTVILLLTAFLLMLCTHTEAKPKQNEVKDDFILGIRKGLAFVYAQKALTGALVLDLFVVLFGGAVALLPIFADTILKTGPAGLGLLRAAPALGAFFSSLFLVRFPPLKNTGRFLFLAVSGFGLCMILFAFSRDFYFSLFLLALSGAFDCVSIVVRSTMIQLMSPDKMRGKVAAVNSIFISSSNELGAFESGLTAQWWGTVNSVWIGGVLTQFVVLVIFFAFPQLRRLKLQDLAAR